MKQPKFNHWDKVTDGNITARIVETLYDQKMNTYKYLLYNASEMYYYPGMYYEDDLSLVK